MLVARHHGARALSHGKSCVGDGLGKRQEERERDQGKDEREELTWKIDIHWKIETHFRHATHCTNKHGMSNSCSRCLQNAHIRWNVDGQ